MRTPSCVRKPEAPDDSACDGNAIFSVSCQDGGSFPSVSTCSELTFSFVSVVRDAIVASSFAGAVITWETMSRWGTARTSSTVAALLDVPRGPVKLICELTVHTAGGTASLCFRKCAITKLHCTGLGLFTIRPSCRNAASSCGLARCYTAGKPCRCMSGSLQP